MPASRGFYPLSNGYGSTETSPPKNLSTSALDLMGPLEVREENRRQLVEHASEAGALRWGSGREAESSKERVAEMLQLVVSTREYQYA